MSLVRTEDRASNFYLLFTFGKMQNGHFQFSKMLKQCMNESDSSETVIAVQKDKRLDQYQVSKYQQCFIGDESFFCLLLNENAKCVR